MGVQEAVGEGRSGYQVGQLRRGVKGEVQDRGEHYNVNMGADRAERAATKEEGRADRGIGLATLPIYPRRV